MSALLSPGLARIFYNVADAWRPDGEQARDLLPAVERELRHQGLGPIRRLGLLLLFLEWRPVFTRHRRCFSRLGRLERRALLLSPGWLAAPLADLRERLDAARQTERG